MGGWKRDLKKKRLEARIRDFETMIKTLRGNENAYKKPGSQKR